jgi:hypothetical protein
MHQPCSSFSPSLRLCLSLASRLLRFTSASSSAESSGSIHSLVISLNLSYVPKSKKINDHKNRNFLVERAKYLSKYFA